jgi:hypothetical protein
MIIFDKSFKLNNYFVEINIISFINIIFKKFKKKFSFFFSLEIQRKKNSIRSGIIKFF